MNTTWPRYLERITVCDALDAGCCFDGVIDFVKKHDGMIASPTTMIIGDEFVRTSANADGNGYGDGYGDGNGYGDGDGYGNGYGNGNGYGDGNGYGYGDGDGYGYGYGYGNGYGDGNSL